MLESQAALHRSHLYRLVARVVILSLLLQGLVPVPGPGIPVAQADEEPPMSVQVFEPPPAVPTPPPVVIPDPVVAVPPDAPLITIPQTVTVPLPPAVEPPPPPYTLGAVPVGVQLSASPASAAPGDLITYTLTLTNPLDTNTQLDVRVELPGLLHWRGGQTPGLPPPAPRAGGLVTATLAVPRHATRRVSFTTQLRGLPSSDDFAQAIAVGVRGQGVMTRTQASVRVPHVETRVTLGPPGGRLATPDRRITLDLPPGALTQTAQLRLRPDYLYEFEPDLGRLFMAFTLEATTQAGGQPIHQLGQPVSLTLEVADLVGTHPFYLLYWNPNTATWETVSGPLTPDPQTGTVTARIEHFSEYGGGDPSKDGWRLLYNETVPALYGGDVSTSYPLALPPGPHGLQPEFTLSYSTARVKGITQWVQSDWAGLGVSADTAEVVRRMARSGLADGVGYGYLDACTHEGDLCFTNDFSLLLNGTSYDLIHQGGGFYRTAEDQFLKIEQVTTSVRTLTAGQDLPPPELQCAGDPSETPDAEHVPLQGGYALAGENRYFDHHWYCTFWRVTTQDGTVYRLGAHLDSEQRAGRVCIGYWEYDLQRHPCAGIPGYSVPGNWWDLAGPVVYRWRLDQVTDVYGNRVEYHYREEQAPGQYEWGEDGFCPGGTGGWCYNFRTDLYPDERYYLHAYTDRASYLEWAGYAWREPLGEDLDPFWGYKVVFDRACRTDPEEHMNTDVCQDQGSEVLAHDGTGEGIEDARAQHANNLSTLWWQRRYLSGIRVLQLSSPTTARVVREYRLGYGTSGERQGDQLVSRVLTSITPYGVGGEEVPDNALPATTFEYVALAQGCCWYGRLSAVHNGYGATTLLTYVANGDGLNHVLASQTVTDGVTPARYTTYTYARPCFGRVSADGDLLCNYHDGTTYPLVGHQYVEEDVREGGPTGRLLSRTRHWYNPEGHDLEGYDWWTDPNGTTLRWRVAILAGRERLTQRRAAGGAVLEESRTVYTTTTTWDAQGQDALFVHSDESIQTQYDPSGAPLVQTRSASVYELQHGKVITQYNYGATRLLPHGGFEEGLVYDWNATMWVPYGWQGFHNPPAPAAAIQVATPAAAAVLGNAGVSLTAVAGYTCECGIKQEVTGLAPDTNYTAYARVRTAAGSTKFRLWLNAGSTHQVVELYPTSNWQVISTTISTGAASSFWLMLTVYPESGAGTIYVDDVYFERLDETGDEQTQQTWYTSNITTSVVVPFVQRVYTGTAALADGQEASMMRYTYDGRPVASGEYWGVEAGALTAQSVYTTVTPNWLQIGYVTTYFEYDAYGNQAVVTDTRGYASTTQYDPMYHAYPMTFTNALGQSSYLRYDFGLGKVISATNANGVRTGLIYDAFGRLVKVIEDENDPGAGPKDTALQPTLQYVYSDTYQTGLIRGPRIETIWREQSATDEVKRQFEFYTGRGLLMQRRSEWGQEASPVQAVVNVEYDALGRVTTSYTPVGEGYSTGYMTPTTTVAKTQTQYDLLGRAVVVTGTDGLTTTTAYHGLQTAVVDANRHQKVSVVDARGQLVTVKEYQDEYPQADFEAQPYATTHYEYNVLGNLTRVMDDQANVTTMSYNAIGQKLGMDDPDMLDWEYRYDAAGNLTSQRDAKLQYTCFYYDPLSRLKGKVFHGASDCSETDPGYSGYSEAYYYDQPGHGYGLGQRTTMTNTNAVVSWVYDRRGRVTAETRRVTGMGVYTSRMDYDTASRVLTTTYPTGEMITQTYTAAWQPERLGTTWQAYPYGEANYNVRGQLANYNHYNLLHTDYAYEETGATPSFRLAELKLQRFDTGAQWLTFEYQYDNVGNLTRLTEATNAGQRQCFVYDALDRLTSAFTGSDDCTAYSARGSAPYDHQGANDYRYDELGSITQLAGRVYDYAGSGHAHAVRYASVLGSGKFNNFTSAAPGWTLCPTYCALDTDSGEGVLRNGPSSGGGTTSVYSTGVSLTAGQGLQIEFQASRDGGNAPDMILGLETSDSLQRFGIIAEVGQNLRVQRGVAPSGKTTFYYTPFSPAYTLENGTWYVLRLFVGDSGSHKFKLALWKRDDPSVRRYYELATTPGAWVGKTWRVRNWVNAAVGNNNRVLLDSYMEFLSASNGVWSYRYDGNGNMISRIEQGVAYAQAWDEQNRLVQVVYGPLTTTASLTYTVGYDADGGRVLQVAPGGYRTAYSGAYEETITPTAVLNEGFGSNPPLNWTAHTGSWAAPFGAYLQTAQGAGQSTSERTGVSYGEITATVQVQLMTGTQVTNTLAGLVVRRPSGTGNSPSYFVAIRNVLSAYYCGIYEWYEYQPGQWRWENRTPGLTACKYAAGTGHTLEARVLSGRVEMYVDGAFKAAWVDTTPAAAAGLALQTIDGTAAFDDVQVYGATTRSYYLFGGARVGERVTNLTESASAGDLYALHSDHLGSVSLATDAGGMTVTLSLARYFPFGAERGTAASGSPTDFAYATGRESSFGLVHLGARWLDSCLGRWTSPDSIVPDAANPQDSNRYSYARNNPTIYTDPSGHSVCDEDSTCASAGGGSNGTLSLFYWDQLMNEDWNARVLQYLKDHPDYTHGSLGNDYLLPVEAQALFIPLVFEAERQRTGEWPAPAALFEGMGAVAAYGADVDSLNLGGSGPGGAGVADLRRVMNPDSTSRGTTVFAQEVPDYLTPATTPRNPLHVDAALDQAQGFLGEGYLDMGGGRFVSADGLRQVRMADNDILGQHAGGKHINTDTRIPIPGQPGRYVHTRGHIFFWE